jgi:hypothetical protein
MFCAWQTVIATSIVEIHQQAVHNMADSFRLLTIGLPVYADEKSATGPSGGIFSLPGVWCEFRVA